MSGGKVHIKLSVSIFSFVKFHLRSRIIYSSHKKNTLLFVCVIYLLSEYVMMLYSDGLPPMTLIKNHSKYFISYGLIF